MNLLQLPNHAARIGATLAAMTAERSSLMRQLNAAADAGDEGDAIAGKIDTLDRDIARTKLKHDAAQAARQRDQEVEQAKALAKRRKATEKALDKYQASAELAEKHMQAAAEAIGQMRADFSELERVHPDRDALAYAATIKPTAMVERLMEVMRERIARQLKREGSMPASSARIERMSVGDAFAAKLAGLLPWLANK